MTEDTTHDEYHDGLHLEQFPQEILAMIVNFVPKNSVESVSLMFTGSKLIVNLMQASDHTYAISYKNIESTTMKLSTLFYQGLLPYTTLDPFDHEPRISDLFSEPVRLKTRYNAAIQPSLHILYFPGFDNAIIKSLLIKCCKTNDFVMLGILKRRLRYLYEPVSVQTKYGPPAKASFEDELESVLAALMTFSSLPFIQAFEHISQWSSTQHAVSFDRLDVLQAQIFSCDLLDANFEREFLLRLPSMSVRIFDFVLEINEIQNAQYSSLISTRFVQEHERFVESWEDITTLLHKMIFNGNVALIRHLLKKAIITPEMICANVLYATTNDTNHVIDYMLNEFYRKYVVDSSPPVSFPLTLFQRPQIQLLILQVVNPSILCTIFKFMEENGRYTDVKRIFDYDVSAVFLDNVPPSNSEKRIVAYESIINRYVLCDGRQYDKHDLARVLQYLILDNQPISMTCYAIACAINDTQLVFNSLLASECRQACIDLMCIEICPGVKNVFRDKISATSISNCLLYFLAHGELSFANMALAECGHLVTADVWRKLLLDIVLDNHTDASIWILEKSPLSINEDFIFVKAFMEATTKHCNFMIAEALCNMGLLSVMANSRPVQSTILSHIILHAKSCLPVFWTLKLLPIDKSHLMEMATLIEKRYCNNGDDSFVPTVTGYILTKYIDCFNFQTVSEAMRFINAILAYSVEIEATGVMNCLVIRLFGAYSTHKSINFIYVGIFRSLCALFFSPNVSVSSYLLKSHAIYIDQIKDKYCIHIRTLLKSDFDPTDTAVIQNSPNLRHQMGSEKNLLAKAIHQLVIDNY